MAKNTLLDAQNGIVAILEPLESDQRARVIQAALTLLGDQKLPMSPTWTKGGSGNSGTAHGTDVGAKAYFDMKEPKNKGEELATAARFREEHEGAESSTKEELKTVINAARRNFDAKHYSRDLDNARNKGLFNRGTGADAAILSHYGQSYVDAMPDRDAVKKLRKPKRGGAKKKATKKKTTRK